MKETWLEKSFLICLRNRYPDGYTGYRLLIGGKVLYDRSGRNAMEAETSGFLLSLYKLVIARPPTKDKILGRFTDIPLLRAVIGERAMHEEVIYTAEYRHEGVDYQFEKIARWEIYKNIPWFSISGSKNYVYRVVGDHPEVSDISFSLREWRERNIDPSLPMILEQARKLKRLENEMTANLKETMNNFDDSTKS